MARKQREIPGPPTVAAWLGTYGDMVTLVLTFFVLLFSFSTIDAAKWQQLVESFAGKTPSFVSDGQPLDIPNPPAVVELPSDKIGDEASDQSWTEMFESLKKSFEQKEKEMQSQTGSQKKLAEMSKTDSEIVILLPESLLFDSGRYDLKPEAEEILQDLALMLDPKTEQIASIVIEGHTDTIPVNITQVIRDNLDLGYQRAAAVFAAMRDSYPFLSPNKFVCLSQGEYHPVFDEGDEFTGDTWDTEAYQQWLREQNSTPERRLRNRRCVIILKRNHAFTYVAPPSASPAPSATPDSTADPDSGTVPDPLAAAEAETDPFAELNLE